VSALSLSLLLPHSEAFAVQVVDSEPLSSALPRLLRLDARLRAESLQRSMLIVAHTAEIGTATLHDLGARNGDWLIVLARRFTPVQNAATLANKTGVIFTALPDTGDHLIISDDVPIAQLVPHLLPLSANLAHLTPKQVMLAVGQTLIDFERRPRELGLRSGDLIGVMPLTPVARRVRLCLISPRGAHPPLIVEDSPCVLGRRDSALGDQQPNLDLSDALPRNKARAISRRQAIFTEQDGIWRVRLHPESGVPMFVDNRRLAPDRAIALAEDNVISFGASPNRPDFQLLVRLEIP
jgi:hypothetical protein